MRTRTRSGSRVQLLVEEVDDILHRFDRLQLFFGDLEIDVLLEANREIDQVQAVELQVLDEPGVGTSCSSRSSNRPTSTSRKRLKISSLDTSGCVMNAPHRRRAPVVERLADPR